MTAALVILLMTAACVGAGAVLLRLTQTDIHLTQGERLSWAFALGFGVLGWSVYFLALIGWITALPLLLLCGGLAIGGVFMTPAKIAAPTRPDIWFWILLAALCAVLAGDILEGLSPPADADSMAYHFATPKLFLEAGRLFFIPRASDGAAPLLPQMTYMTALALGGERAMTLWCGVSGWGIGAVVYTAGRRWLTPNWALVAALLVLTTPAVIYAAGTGQVETRTAMFVAVAAFATAMSRRTGHLGFAAIAGLAAGCFMASKYPGLLFVAGCGLVILCQRRWLASAFVFGCAALLAGGEWYAWIWWNTGDPVFPMLYGLVPYAPGVPWNPAQQAFMRNDFFAAERVLPQNLWSFLAYPALVTFNTNPVFEAGRTGFGPFALLVLPFVLTAAWLRGRELLRSRWLDVTLICLGFYALWFFFGTSQRIRHFLPIYPILVLALTVPLPWMIRFLPARAPILFAVVATLLLQIMAQGLFSLKFIRHFASGESREHFLLYNVNRYSAAQWINTHLRQSDKIFVPFRDLIYLIDIPVFYAHWHVEARVEIRSDSTDPALFWRQLRAQNITHLLDLPFSADQSRDEGEGGPFVLAHKLIQAGCARVIADIPTLSSVASRTLETRVENGQLLEVLELMPSSCRL